MGGDTLCQKGGEGKVLKTDGTRGRWEKLVEKMV